MISHDILMLPRCRDCPAGLVPCGSSTSEMDARRRPKSFDSWRHGVVLLVLLVLPVLAVLIALEDGGKNEDK